MCLKFLLALLMLDKFEVDVLFESSGGIPYVGYCKTHVTHGLGKPGWPIKGLTCS